MLHRSGIISNMSLEDIKKVCVQNSEQLVEKLGKVVDQNLKELCSVVNIAHFDGYKIQINNKEASVEQSVDEEPGSKLKRTDEPTELQFFSYEQLKKSAHYSDGYYRGKLYGTIELCVCGKTIDCPDCSGSGNCSTCGGSEKVTCPVCEGNKECVSCNGTGRYTCQNCDGDGECPECDSGWYTCDECGGDGTVDCPECDGSGIYIDDSCKYCGGTGYIRDKTCRHCGGSGRFERICKRCDGCGRIRCGTCAGNGGWRCKACNGTGKCSHCRGVGSFTCKACHGKGHCGKCRGKGKVWCPDCKGTGKCVGCTGTGQITCPRCKGLGEYQTYNSYKLSDVKETVRLLCSLPVDDKDFDCITGETCYEGVVYDFFAGRASVFNDQSVVKCVPDDRKELIQKWISLKQNSFTEDKINADYIHTEAVLTKFPITKILFVCNNKHFTIYIVGNSKVVFCNRLPDLSDRFIVWMKNTFKK